MIQIPVSAASFGVCVSFDAAGESTKTHSRRQGARWLPSPEHDALQSGFRLKKLSLSGDSDGLYAGNVDSAECNVLN
jgi:hypothetical protein